MKKMLSLKWALFLLLILLIPYNCESDSDSDSSDGDMTEDSTPKTPTAKEENTYRKFKIQSSRFPKLVIKLICYILETNITA